MRRRLPFVVLLAVTGCGARSNLFESSGPTATNAGGAASTSSVTATSASSGPTGSGGMGGSADAGSSGGSGGAGGEGAGGIGGQGGSGGSPTTGPCVAFELWGDEIAAPQVPGFHMRRPAVRDGSVASDELWYSLTPADEAGIVPSAIGAIHLQIPIKAWPPVFKNAKQIADAGGQGFVAKGGGWLAGVGPADPSPIAYSGTGFDPRPGTALFLDSWMASNLPLGGYDVVSNGAHQIATVFFDPFALLTPHIIDLSCGNRPLAADATRLGDDYLVVAAADDPSGKCAANAAPPTYLRLARLTANPFAATTIGALSGGDPISAVRIVSRAPGAWLFSRRDAAGGSSGAIMAQRIDAMGLPEGAPIEAVPPGRGEFSVDTTGKGFTIAWFESTTPGSVEIGLSVFNPTTGMLAPTMFAPASTHATSGRLLLTTFLLDQVVAWTAEPAVPGRLAEIHMARFRCVAGS